MVINVKGVAMKLNQRGSFTVEASLIMPVIILIIVIFFKSMISQYLFYYVRGVIRLNNENQGTVETGIYFDTKTTSKEIITFEEKKLLIQCQSQKLNYLEWAHSYLMAEEIIGVFNEEVSQDNK